MAGGLLPYTGNKQYYQGTLSALFLPGDPGLHHNGKRICSLDLLRLIHIHDISVNKEAGFTIDSTS